MTILFNDNIKNLIIGRGLLNQMPGATGSGAFIGTVSVTVFSGVQPSAATISANWTNYNTAYLAHWTSVQFYQPLYNVPGSGVMLTMYGSPAPTLGYNTGTASWGIIWMSDILPNTIQGSALPNANFIVGNVSLGGGSGIIRMADLSIVSGNSHSLLDCSITAS